MLVDGARRHNLNLCQTRPGRKNKNNLGLFFLIAAANRALNLLQNMLVTFRIGAPKPCPHGHPARVHCDHRFGRPLAVLHGEDV